MWKRVYVWEPVVRVQHWVHVVAMVVLAITGVYIAHPFIDLPAGQAVQFNLTDSMRYIHFVASWILGLGYLVRFYWFFVGNRYARWGDWLPVGEKRWKGLWKQFRYYIFLERERPRWTGVNPVSGLTYLFLGVLLFLTGFTGIALYAEAFSIGFWNFTFGWVAPLFGSQNLRLIHHALLYLYVIFLMIHLYMMVLGDFEEENAPMTSIVSGWKYEPIDE
jgi:Ni/Fe-hydrogenase 1 B-type cytochrome subunit